MAFWVSKWSSTVPACTRCPSFTVTWSTTPATGAVMAWAGRSGCSLPCTTTVSGRGAQKAQSVVNPVAPTSVHTSTEEGRRVLFSSTG